MLAFLSSALIVGITPGNIISWLSLEIMRHQGSFFGTLRLRAKARLLGVRVGRKVRAHGPVGLLRWPGGKIEIGDEVSIISSWRRATAAPLAFPTRLRVFGKGAAIIIGEKCQLNGTAITARSCPVTLGRQVMLGPNCIITDSDFHALWPPEKRALEPGYDRDKAVSIGDYAWIGMNSIILKGVTIGAGAIVGAGSVVTRDVPANSLACGNPARTIRKLDPAETRTMPEI